MDKKNNTDNAAIIGTAEEVLYGIQILCIAVMLAVFILRVFGIL